MTPFLERIAAALLKDHRHELDRVAVVLPSRRAGTYLRRYLGRLAGATIWSPELMDPGAFMSRVAGMRQGSSLEMLFMLYRVHCQVEGDRAEPFADFLRWAPITLRDMSEIDAHLLDLENVYRDLRAYHEIEEWSFRPDTSLSPGQTRMLRQWRHTGELHAGLWKAMNESSCGTSGAIEKMAAQVSATVEWTPAWKAVYIVGLNAVDPAMTKVLTALESRGTLKLAWDADTYYLDDKMQEAGRYLRRSVETLGAGIVAPGRGIAELDRRVDVVTVPDGISQARYAAQWLQGLSPDERADTAVVLADEHLLQPLLDALPPEVDPVNVTMGIALNKLPVAGLIDAFLQYHASCSGGRDPLIATIEKLLLHPFLHQGRATANTVAALRASGSTRLGVKDLLRLAREGGMQLFDTLERALLPVSGNAEMQARITNLIDVARLNRPNDVLVQEQLFRLARMENDLWRSLALYAPEGTLDMGSFQELHSKALREEQLDLFGEPLAGLQVMGLLETRALDHERVLILGANDDVLPGSGSLRSWIPFEIRRAYDLPLRADSEAITAYHVHRLLHHASEVRLVGHAGGADGSGAVTRFVAQWEHALPDRSATRISKYLVHASTHSRNTPIVQVVKDEAVMKRLRALAAKGFSPSVLGTWLRCPLDLYFTKLLGISPPDENDGSLGSDVLGTAVHKVLEEVFAPFVGKAIDPTELIAATAGVHDRVVTHLRQQHAASILASGHYRLRIDMAVQAIGKYLEAEAERCRTSTSVIVALERSLSCDLADGIRLNGFCDRIEVRDGITHVLDLKTGGARPEDLILKDLSREHIGPDRRFALQLLIYAYLVMANDPEIDVVRAGVVPLRQPSRSAGIWLTIGGSTDIRRGSMDEIAALLIQLVAELMDPTIPFQHDPESTYCTSCLR